MKFRPIVIIALLSVALAPVAAMYLWVQPAYEKNVRDARIRSLSALADQAEARIQSNIDQLQATVDIISNQDTFTDTLTSTQLDELQRSNRLRQLVRGVSRSMERKGNILVLDTNLKPLLNIETQFGSIYEPGIVEQTVIDNLNVGPASDVQITPLQIDHRLTFLAHKRIFDQHTLVGHLAVVCDGEFLHRILNADSGLGDTGEWLFAIRGDENQAIFAVPLKYDPEAAFVRAVPHDRLDVPITQALRNHETTMLNAPDYREHPVIAVTRYIPETDWGLVAKIDQAEALADVAAARSDIAAIALAAAALASITALLLELYISKTIRKQVSQTIGQGFGLRTPPANNPQPNQEQKDIQTQKPATTDSSPTEKHAA